MAVTTSFSFGFVESIDPFSITGRSDATSLSNGGVAVVGDHIGHTDLTTFEADGDVAGSASVITGVDSAVTQLSNGNIVVLSDIGTDMSFRIVTIAGATVRADTSIGEAGADALDPEVAALAGGGFVVAIQDFFGGTDNDVDLRIYDNGGNLLLNFAVDGSGANDQNPSVAGLADGGFAVAWHRNIGSENEIWYAVYEANGTVRKAPALLDSTGTVNRNASVVALDNGGFAIAYEDNGWSTTDIDITLARFNAAGTFVDWDDISQSTANETGPSATVLSNGMIAVAYTDDVFADTDTRVTLVDQNTGAALGTSTIGGSLNNESEITIAAMNNGQIGTFHTNSTTGDVVGSIRQATRFSSSDAAADTIIVDSLRDVATGNDGNDTFQGGGADAFTTDMINGGNGSDRILVSASTTLANTTLTSIEEIEILFPNVATVVRVRADQIGAGLANNLIVDFSLDSSPDVFRVDMLADTSLNMSLFQVQDFDAVGEGDRLIVMGDANDESIWGTLVRDELYGNAGVDKISGGGGDDHINGGDGADLLNGGIGIDTLVGGNGNDGYYADVTGERIFETNASLATGGNDLVRYSGAGSFSLGTNIEKLQITSAGIVAGIGNTLANTLIGGTGSNTLSGRTGNDILTGGAAVDRFVFDTPLNAATNVDRITDMTIADFIQLKKTVFAAIGPTLTAGEFVANTTGLATQADDRIIYETDTGELYYDSNGNAAGGSVLFAILTTKPAIGFSDFQMI